MRGTDVDTDRRVVQYSQPFLFDILGKARTLSVPLPCLPTHPFSHIQTLHIGE